MKVLWIVLGVLGGLCLLCGGGAYFLFNKGMAVVTEVGKYGDDSFRAIATTWDASALEQRFAPEAAMKGAAAQKIDMYREKLGPLKGEFKSHLTGYNSSNNNGVGSTTATWTATATFEKGPASIVMQLVNHDNKWMIKEFQVDAAALSDTSPSSPGSGTSADDDGGTKPDEPNLPAETTGNTAG